MSLSKQDRLSAAKLSTGSIQEDDIIVKHQQRQTK